MNLLSRRRFVALTGAGLAVPSLRLGGEAPAAAMTAQEVIDRIKKGLGAEWKADSADGLKAGDPAAVVTGVATTSLATLDVLQRAVKARANLIVTSEPTFYSRADTPTPPVRRLGPLQQPGAESMATAPPLAPDLVFTAKDAFIKQHGLVVFRLGENWALRKPDPFAQGLADTLGWAKAAGSEPRVLTISETSLGALVSHVKGSLKSRGGIRVVGDPQTRLRRIALLPGSTPLKASMDVLPEVDAIVAGEVREWETVEYVRDAVDLGGNKALVLVGRVVSEDPGMQLCARWLKTVAPEVHATWISAGDPYWRPTA